MTACTEVTLTLDGTHSFAAGDHEIDIEFDSVFMVNNGGSYYELEFNIT